MDTLEEMWQEFRDQTLDQNSPRGSVTVIEIAFKSGALVVFRSIMNKNGLGPAEMFKYLSSLEENFEEFLSKLAAWGTAREMAELTNGPPPETL